MLVAKKHGASEFYEETDHELAANFVEAGFGFPNATPSQFHPLEAAYLAKIGKTSFAKKPKSGKGFGFASAVYNQIRATGRLVRPYMKKTDFFRVYEPGVGREENRPSQLVCLLPGAIPSAKSLSGQIKIAHLARLDLIIACGAEKEIKYYKVASFNF